LLLFLWDFFHGCAFSSSGRWQWLHLLRLPQGSGCLQTLLLLLLLPLAYLRHHAAHSFETQELVLAS
jgi:hypothetical protein